MTAHPELKPAQGVLKVKSYVVGEREVAAVFKNVLDTVYLVIVATSEMKPGVPSIGTANDLAGADAWTARYLPAAASTDPL